MFVSATGESGASVCQPGDTQVTFRSLRRKMKCQAPVAAATQPWLQCDVFPVSNLSIMSFLPCLCDLLSLVHSSLPLSLSLQPLLSRLFRSLSSPSHGVCVSQSFFSRPKLRWTSTLSTMSYTNISCPVDTRPDTKHHMSS